MSTPWRHWVIYCITRVEAAAHMRTHSGHMRNVSSPLLSYFGQSIVLGDMQNVKSKLQTSKVPPGQPSCYSHFYGKDQARARLSPLNLKLEHNHQNPLGQTEEDSVTLKRLSIHSCWIHPRSWDLVGHLSFESTSRLPIRPFSA